MFDSYHPVYRDAFGGFSNYWHKVFDLKGIKNKFVSKNLEILNKYLNQQYEFIPYLRFDVLNNFFYKKNLKTQAVEIISSDHLNTVIRFSDNSIEKFDYVFVCHGALPPNDLLINSGLAKLSGFVSDHLIGETRPVKIKSPLKIKRVGYKGFLRPYKIVEINKIKAKHIIRPHFGKNNKGLSNSIIYAGSDVKAAIKLLKHNSLNLILNASSTRYGFPLKSKFQKSFFQVPALNMYEYCKSGIFPIQNQYLDLSRKLEELEINGPLKSSIHYYNTYSLIDKSIANRVFDNKKTLILVSPQFNYIPGVHHFTADLLSTSENIVAELFESKL